MLIGRAILALWVHLWARDSYASLMATSANPSRPLGGGGGYVMHVAHHCLEMLIFIRVIVVAVTRSWLLTCVKSE